jgi:hypothetical protein
MVFIDFESRLSGKGFSLPLRELRPYEVVVYHRSFKEENERCWSIEAVQRFFERVAGLRLAPRLHIPTSS